MNDSACGLLGFDLGTCVSSTLFGWFAPWWPYIYWGSIGLIALALLTALYRIWLIFGWAGVQAVLATIVFTIGFILGRKSVVRATMNSAGKPTVKFPGHAAPVVVKRPQHVRTIFDILAGN